MAILVVRGDVVVRGGFGVTAWFVWCYVLWWWVCPYARAYLAIKSLNHSGGLVILSPHWFGPMIPGVSGICVPCVV